MNLSIQILPRRHFQEPCCVDRQTLPLLCKSSPSKDEVSIKWRLHEDINLMSHTTNRLSVFFVGPIANNLTPTWWAILSGYWISIRSQGDSINFFDHNAITWIRNALSSVPYILGKLRPPLWACFEWDETQRKNLANDCSLGIMRWNVWRAFPRSVYSNWHGVTYYRLAPRDPQSHHYDCWNDTIKLFKSRTSYPGLEKHSSCEQELISTWVMLHQRASHVHPPCSRM